jgi:hypothetical protein
MSNIKLKPCPFCGGKCDIERIGTSRVSMQYQCGECGCSLETGETWLDDDCRWNTRHNDTLTAKVAELEALVLKIRNIAGAQSEQGACWDDEIALEHSEAITKVYNLARKALEAES